MLGVDCYMVLSVIIKVWTKDEIFINDFFKSYVNATEEKFEGANLLNEIFGD